MQSIFILSSTKMLLIGSICALIAGSYLCRNFRESWTLILEQFLWNIKYYLLATKATIHDWIHAKDNKNECTAQTGRVAIVTGGSRGIGLEVVRMFLELDMEVIIACRKPSIGDKAVMQIRESGVKTGKPKVYKLDNASLEAVKHFAAEIKKDYKEIHILVNNAGVMFCPYNETPDGFEQQWAVNYLSHFLLTSLLLPLLKAGGLTHQSSRIVNVTSCAHLLGTINLNDINNKSRFITEHAYAQSKLALEIFTKTLQNLLKEKQYPVQVYSVHPGVVLTDLFLYTIVGKYKSLFQYFLKTPAQGAISIVYAAVNKEIENCGGTYISNCLPAQVHPDVLNPNIQKKMFELSVRQVKLSDFFYYVQ